MYRLNLCVIRKGVFLLDLKMFIEVITPLFTLVLGAFLFYDAKKRKEIASAKKAEAENITTYANEWKELYEKKESKVEQLNEKIDELYSKLNEYRGKIRDLKDERAELRMEIMKLTYHRCDVKGCDKRQPPSEVMN